MRITKRKISRGKKLKLNEKRIRMKKNTQLFAKNTANAYLHRVVRFFDVHKCGNSFITVFRMYTLIKRIVWNRHVQQIIFDSIIFRKEKCSQRCVQENIDKSKREDSFRFDYCSFKNRKIIIALRIMSYVLQSTFYSSRYYHGQYRLYKK